MDCSTGELIELEQLRQMEELVDKLKGTAAGDDVAKVKDRFIECAEPLTAAQWGRGKVKGHERCPCGSGKLFKNCHRRG